MTIVVDASVVLAALVNPGAEGRWAEHQLESAAIVAPHLMPVEAANVLRRVEARGDISSSAAALAFRDLVELPVYLYPFEPFATRVWDLRGTVTSYDAWYVAIAESLDAALVTLDAKLSRAPGPRCRFQTPTRES